MEEELAVLVGRLFGDDWAVALVCRSFMEMEGQVVDGCWPGGRPGK